MNITCNGYTVPYRSAKRIPRLTGDTRRRKKRLRLKLDKRDLVKYGPTWTSVQNKLLREMSARLECTLFGITPAPMAFKSQILSGRKGKSFMLIRRTK